MGAALGGIPLDIVRTSMDPSQDPELYAKYEKWGLQILTTAVLSILITAPIGLFVIQNLGHHWLANDAPAKGAGDAAPKPLGRDDRRDKIEMRAEVLAEIESHILTDAQKECAASECDVVDLEDIMLEAVPSQKVAAERPQKQNTPLPVLLCSPIHLCAGKLPKEECQV